MAATVPLKPGVRDADDARMGGVRWPAWVTAATAAVVAAVLGAGVVSAAAVERRVAQEERQARAAGAQVEGVDAPTTTVAAAAPVSLGTAPPATVAPVRTDLRTTTTARGRVASPGSATTVTGTPRSSTTVAAPPPGGTLDPWPDADRHFQPGRTSWSTTDGNWSLSARVDNAAPWLGQPVRFDFEVSSTVDPCCGISVLFDSAPSYSAQSGPGCPVSEPRQAASARFSTTVAFERLGWQRFTIAARTGGCWPDPPRLSLVGEIEVKPRPLNFQGPQPPALSLSVNPVPGHVRDRSWLGLSGEAKDLDGGRIRSVTIDWGDGSPVSRPSEPVPPACRIEPDGSAVAESMTFETVPHQYPAPGSYLVTVTAVSTACDGVSMPQAGSSSFAWSV